MLLFNILPTESFIPPLLILVATVTSNLWQEKIFLPTYNSSFHAKQCLRCGMFLCRTKHLLCWAWARTQEWGWGGGTGHCAHQPFPSAGSSKASEGQCLSPVFWVQVLCIHHTFLLVGWKGCPVLLYPQGLSVGPDSFPWKTDGSFLWDPVAAKIQISLLCVTVASCSGVTSHRHLVCLTPHLWEKKACNTL